MIGEQLHQHPEEERRLDCGTCHREIPHTVAASPEGKEYIGHYCEPPCLMEWQSSTGNR